MLTSSICTSAKAIEHNVTTTEAFPCWHLQAKILGRVLLNRLTEQLLDKVLLENQCGFRSG